MMKLTVVGCSGSISGPDSPASSYLLQAPHEDRVFSLLMDCGPGAMGALYRYMDPCEVDAIALSHLHPDHCLDLCGYYVAARYSPNAPWPRRPVYAPADADSRLARAYEVTANPPAVSESGVSFADALRLACLAAQPADRAVHRALCSGGPSGRRIRNSRGGGCARRRRHGVLRRHWTIRGSASACGGCRSAAGRIVLSRRAQQSARDASFRRASCGNGTGRSSPCGSAHPYSALARIGTCPRRSEAAF